MPVILRAIDMCGKAISPNITCKTQLEILKDSQNDLDIWG